MAITFNNTRLAAATVAGLASTASMYYVVGASSSFTGRSLTAATDLFTDTAVTNDYLAFRILNFAYKPQGIVFDIATAMVTATGHTITWQYRKADGTWANFAGVTDNTNNFTTVGTGLTVTWTMPTDWGTNNTAVNGLTGSMWIRALLTVTSTLSEGGRLGSTGVSVYTYSVKVEAGHEYDSGTATSGSSFTIVDTSKSWTVNALVGRFVWVHTGQHAGTVNYILSNTATTLTLFNQMASSYDNTSQYTILANFEDIYQADVTGGWGVVTKNGSHSYTFDCMLEIEDASFGDANALVQFEHDFYFYCSVASTIRNPIVLGMRLPALYGLGKGILGNTIMGVRTTAIDSRGVGFTATTDYAFSADNRFILRHDIDINSTVSFLRHWFYNYQKESIGDVFQGFRSVIWPNVDTEVRNLKVCNGHSGIEQPFAKFDGVESTFSASLGLFITTARTMYPNGFDVTPNNRVGSKFGSQIQTYNHTGITYLDDYKGARVRPMSDPFALTNPFEIFARSTLQCQVSDEFGNTLSNAKVEISDSLALNRQTFLNFDGAVGNNDVVTAPNHATGNQFSGATSFSFEAWAWGVSLGGGTVGRIIDKGSNSSLGYALWNNSGNWRCAVYTSSGVKLSNTIAAVLGTLNQLVGVWDGSTIQLYVNNATGTAVAATGTATDDSGVALHIGNSPTLAQAHAGFIRRVRLFRNTALSAANVETLWNEGKFIQDEVCPVSGCTGEYNFTEGTGTTLADTSGNANTATLGAATAAPVWVDVTAGAVSNSQSITTGTLGAYLSGQAIGGGGSYSLTNQPASPIRLRLVLSDYSDTSAAGGSNGNIIIAGTDYQDNPIEEIVWIENFGNGVYYTRPEFKTVNASGITVTGVKGTLTIDNLGIIPSQKVVVERWTTPDDYSLVVSDHNPIIIKVTRPGFVPVKIKKTVTEPLDLVISMKRSELDLTR